MNTIVRLNVKSKYIAPERVPAMPRRWRRALTAFNAADDQRPLADATSQDAAEDRAAAAAELTKFDRARHHADMAHLTARIEPLLVLPTPMRAISDSIVSNAPNAESASASPAVGLTFAA